MSKQTKKCKECGSQHYNGRVSGKVEDVCHNCKVFLYTFWNCINALNAMRPLTGKPRRISIIEYKLEKTNE